MKLNRLAIALIAITLTSLSTNAEPNYTYVLQPGQAYVNKTNEAQEIYVIQKDTKSDNEKQSKVISTYQSLSNGINMATNLMYSIKTLSSQFGSSY